MITMPFTPKAESGGTPSAPSQFWIGKSLLILAVGLPLTVAAAFQMKSCVDRKLHAPATCSEPLSALNRWPLGYNGDGEKPQALLYETPTMADGLLTTGYLGVWLTMFGGGAVTILLFFLIHVLLNTRREALRMSEKLIVDLEESEYFATDVMDSLTSGIAVLNPKGIVVAVNEAWRKLSAAKSGDSCVATSDPGKLYLDPRRSDGEKDCEECAAVQQGIRTVLLGEKESFTMEYGCGFSLEQRWFIIRVSRLKGSRQGVVIIQTEITERKELAAQVQNARRYAENIVETVREPLVVLDPELMILTANQSFYDTFKATARETIGKYVYDLGNRQWDIPRLRCLLEEIFTNDTRITDYEVEHDFRIIGSRTILLNARQIIQGNIGPAIILLSMEDITKQKKIEEMLRHVGFHDRLTGLYNRAFFDEELERLATGGTFPLSIVMADLNGLKKINDTQGHGAGDQLIQLASRIIKRAFRAEDIVARIGGDEFAILLPGAPKSVAEEVVKRIMASQEITAGQVSIAFGIGLAKHGGMLGEALKLSDKRMYRDKAEQKIACYCHGPVG